MVDVRSHVFNYEAGGISFHSQAAVYPIMPSNGKYLTADDVASKIILDVDVHYSPTRVISLENTLNGTIMPIDEIERIRALTKEHDIKLHLDGARLWHASIATGISMKEYCSHFDTISLCLSKGIGAPIGSILVGSEASIKKARHFRLLFGGGWRQAGLLAEAALWGIKTNWPTMKDTHRLAKRLERAFRQAGCRITNPVDTNMVWIDSTKAGFTVDDLMVELAKERIKISGSGCEARVVLHYQITDEAVERFIKVLRKMTFSAHLKANTCFTNSPKHEGSVCHEHSDEVALIVPLSPGTPTVGQSVRFPLVYAKAKYSTVEVQRKTVAPANHEARTEVPGPSWSANSPSSKKSHFEERAEFESTVDPTVPFRYLSDQPLSRKLLSRPLPPQPSDQDEIAALIAAEQQTMERPRTAADKKLGNTLQYHLAHSPAGKALKSAKVRIVRWGSLVACET